MAEYTVGREDVGLYELALPAGTLTQVHVPRRQGFTVTVINHGTDVPLYVRIGQVCALKDKMAQQILPSSLADVVTGYDPSEYTISMICGSATTVSMVFR